MLIAYDSRVDKISKVRNLFHLLSANGTTPEGLCFEAIMKEIEPASSDKDSYFLNFSDGMPMFGNDDIDYHHDTAIDHTKKMVDDIRNRGVKLLVTLSVTVMIEESLLQLSKECMVMMLNSSM